MPISYHGDAISLSLFLQPPCWDKWTVAVLRLAVSDAT